MATEVAEIEQQSKEGFIRGLGLLDSTMIVAGSMIGSGIFIVSADIARQVGSPGWLLVVWMITGLLTVIGALSLRRAGGDDAKGRRAIRLSARSLFAVVGLSLRLDAFPGYPDRHDRGGGGRVRRVTAAFSFRGSRKRII